MRDAPGFDRARPVADAVLYEGYLLYPYRRSSPKNRMRWQFGVLAPRAWVEADGPVAESVAGSVESWYQQTECLVEADRDALLHVLVRYLQVQAKSVQRRTARGYEPVEWLDVDAAVHVPFDEAVPREVAITVPLTGTCTADVGSPGGADVELLGDTGRILRTREPVAAVTTLAAEPLDRGYRLRIRTENRDTTTAPDTARPAVLRRALVATHTLLGGDGLRFVSSIDPPDWAVTDVRACRNLHMFPVLCGASVLSAPILLADHPQIAPESPGDLHDAAEIDEILSLRTLTLTEAEKREARATDPRAAHILDRVDAMPPEVFARLHGAIRSPRTGGAP